MKPNDFPFKEECYQIIGAAMEVHNELGCGFLEAVYQEALAILLDEKLIPFEKEKILDIAFRGNILSKKYIADFLCFDDVIVELKAADSILPEHIAQVLNYLKATNKKIGLLINFGTTRLQYKRVIR
ncbi:GxxExxY protein [Marinifilum sp. RC60d5]|uniref:GxxExxY protein n=1 Tax=Marinifilum sp. RC60d5 TaxID=3458414 RepID=UPI0040352ED8